MDDPFDVAIVLGGGVTKNGTLPVHATNRVSVAENLFRQGCVRNILLSGKGWGSTLTEAEAMKRALVEKGVERKILLLEELSKDTIGNAYFSRTLHLEPRGWSRVCVITSQFHLARARQIFDWILGDTYILEYIPASDEGMDEKKLYARHTIEEVAMQYFKDEVMSSIQRGNLEQMHQYLFYRNALHTDDINQSTAVHKKFIEEYGSIGMLYA